MSGIGTIRGVTFQVAQALSDVVDLVVEGRGEAVTIEGANDVVDYEILDGDGRSVAVRQAKARQEPGTWGASELAKIFCAWGEVDYADEAEFAFVTDASLSDSGQRLRDLIRDMRTHPDEEVLRATAASFRGGLPLPPLEVVQRLQILTRMGNADTVLAKVEMRILALLSRARLATLDDAVNAVNALLRTLFINGSSSDLARRTISRAEVLRALRLDEASLQDGLAWSQDTAAAYRVAVAEGDLQVPSFIPMTIRTTVPVPRVLDLVRDPDRDRAKANVKRSLDAVLGEQYTGVVLADEGCQTVDAAQFDSLTREHPAIMLPPGSGSLPLAVTLWAAAVERELRPRKRLYQPPPPANAEQAGPLLTSYLREKDHALQQLASAALPRTVRNSVLAAAGPPGITGYLASPEPGHLGGSELPIRYRRSTEFVVIREEPPPDSGPLALDTVARMMRLHPTLQAAQEIRQALSVLTSYTWPIP